MDDVSCVCLSVSFGVGFLLGRSSLVGLVVGIFGVLGLFGMSYAA